jgi:hypothetical protein
MLTATWLRRSKSKGKNRTAHLGLLRGRLVAATAKYPATLSRSPLPVRPVDRIGYWNMGLPPDRRKRREAALVRPATGPIPGSAIQTNVNLFFAI